jgi:hypothetical protein
MSDEHFTVDGTLLEACASLKSFKKVKGGDEPEGESGVDDPGNPTVDFHGRSAVTRRIGPRAIRRRSWREGWR